MMQMLSSSANTDLDASNSTRKVHSQNIENVAFGYDPKTNAHESMALPKIEEEDDTSVMRPVVDDGASSVSGMMRVQATENESDASSMMQRVDDMRESQDTAMQRLSDVKDDLK